MGNSPSINYEALKLPLTPNTNNNIEEIYLLSNINTIDNMNNNLNYENSNKCEKCIKSITQNISDMTKLPFPLAVMFFINGFIQSFPMTAYGYIFNVTNKLLFKFHH